jgi:hypothetical protein
MSGRMKDIKSSQSKKKKNSSSFMSAINEARKKAKLLIADPLPSLSCNTCGQIPRADHLTICGQCGCKNSTIDTSKLDLSNHRAVKDIPFGKDSLKDSDYSHVRNMLPEDMVHEFCSYFVRDCRNGNDAVTQEELQQYLNKLDTKQIITKLVAFRRKEVAEKWASNVHQLRVQLKDMKKQIKSLKNNVSYAVILVWWSLIIRRSYVLFISNYCCRCFSDLCFVTFFARRLK